MPAIITVENLSKAYRIGHKEQIPDTLVGAAKSWISDPLRNLRNLRKLDTFSEDQDAEDIVWALRDVSFEIQQGEVVGIIGRNGAGKSTLLKILSNITEPTSGRAIIRGRISSLLEVGTGFHQEMTGRDNIYMNGTVLGMTKREIDRKFDEIVDFSGVERFLDTPIKRYSSGMQVRLAFAVAAHLEPEVLIVDEVLAVGDAEFQKKCLGKMSEISSTGKTVLFVSHNMSAVQTLTSRCICMKDGQILTSNLTGKAIEEYLASLHLDTTSDFTVAQRMSPHHGTKIRICRIAPQYSNNLGFDYGGDLSFEVELDSNLKKDDLRFGATIIDIVGTPILTTLTSKIIETPTSGKRMYKLIIADSRLAPGNYNLALSIGEGAHNEPRVNYDVVNPGAEFVVGLNTSHGAAVFQWSKAYGSIVHTNSRVETFCHDERPILMEKVGSELVPERLANSRPSN